ncbi:hypothetical protein B1R27_28970 [Streptomyces sp. GKU 895]|nr:hypothetical protein B1R27_28970 [Streptomyces sp. GKU 895]
MSWAVTGRSEGAEVVASGVVPACSEAEAALCGCRSRARSAASEDEEEPEVPIAAKATRRW